MAGAAFDCGSAAKLAAVAAALLTGGFALAAGATVFWVSVFWEKGDTPLVLSQGSSPSGKIAVGSEQQSMQPSGQQFGIMQHCPYGYGQHCGKTTGMEGAIILDTLPSWEEH